MATFSWADAFQAVFSSCLPCFRPSSPPSEPRARGPELDGLLADSDVDTLSLHSHPGDRRRAPRIRAPKHIRIFGYDLFGRPPIHLDGADDSDRLWRPRQGASTNASTSTFDDDAAQLDAAAIDGFTPAQLADRARAAVDEEERLRAERHARHERRRARRERKRIAAALALGGEAFEGFQGSGTLPPPPADDFGPFVRGAPVNADADADADDDAADLDGGLYARRPAAPSAGGSGSRSRTTDSRSQTSDSRSRSSASTQPAPTPAPVVPGRRKRASVSSRSRSSASQSVSLASPVSAGFAPDVVVGAPGEETGFPSVGFGRGAGAGFGKSRDMGAFLASRGD